MEPACAAVKEPLGTARADFSWTLQRNMHRLVSATMALQQSSKRSISVAYLKKLLHRRGQCWAVTNDRCCQPSRGLAITPALQ